MTQRSKLQLRTVALVLFGLIALFVTARLISNAMCEISPEGLRKELLARTPLGSSLQEVEKYLNTTGKMLPAPKEYRLNGEKVKRIEISYDRYVTFQSFPYSNVVVVYWIFDKNDCLIDISISGYMDGP